MKAVIIEKFGAPENLKIGEWEKPKPKAQEILVKVHATALNRADTLQRKGMYPVPEGATPILGLELAGEVVEIGSEVNDWSLGDKVFGLIPGGGYAEYAVIHEKMAIEIPETWTYQEAAAIPEVFLTAFQALKWLANIQSEETLLVHAGASGVGTAAIQLAKTMSIKTFVTASAEKHQICLDLGAEKAIDYKSQDFEKEILKLTDNQGVNVIIDFIAAPYFNQNLNVLKLDGRMVMLALMGGVNVQTNLLSILRKRLSILGSTLRSRTLAYQIQLTEDFKDYAFPFFEKKQLKPVIDSVFNWEKAAEAHHYMESNQNKGKIILAIE